MNSAGKKLIPSELINFRNSNSNVVKADICNQMEHMQATDFEKYLVIKNKHSIKNHTIEIDFKVLKT
jgi:hypothetical protein